MSNVAIIEIRPHRGGWQCFEAPGVAPYFVEGDAKQSAITYATSRMRGRTGEIVIYDEHGEVAARLPFPEAEPSSAFNRRS